MTGVHGEQRRIPTLKGVRRLGSPVRFGLVGEPKDAYLAREAKARIKIDEQLAAAGWVAQSADAVNVNAGPGVAVREFVLEKPHGRVDYLLFLDGQPAGVIEAKPEGTTLGDEAAQWHKNVRVPQAGDLFSIPHYPDPNEARAAAERLAQERADG